MKASVHCWGMGALIACATGALPLAGWAQDAPPAQEARTASPVTFNIAMERQARFSQDELRVQPGQQVTVIFQNPDYGLGREHNWVLVLGGEPALEQLVTQINYQNPGSDYLPPNKTGLIAYTPLVPPGGEEVVQFQAPTEPGEYHYLCTNPGHYDTSREHGKLVVEEP